jgi:23S rRNA pseudouridine2605 synthase
LSSCGIASRRKSEELIKLGNIKVNGVTVDKMGYILNDGDIVEYDGKIIKPSEKKYVVFNKPTGYICTKKDDFGRKTIYDLIPGSEDLFSVGRLDLFSSGILLLTNDGDFANEISHPSNEIIKSYVVESAEDPSEGMIKAFVRGIKIDDIIYKAQKIERLKHKFLKIFLHEGKNREIRNVYEKYEITIKRLERYSIGNMNLTDLKIKKGECKSFTLDEIKRMIYG